MQQRGRRRGRNQSIVWRGCRRRHSAEEEEEAVSLKKKTRFLLKEEKAIFGNEQ